MEKKENFKVGLERFVELSDRTQEHLTRMMKKYYRTTPSAYINHTYGERIYKYFALTNATMPEREEKDGFYFRM